MAVARKVSGSKATAVAVMVPDEAGCIAAMRADHDKAAVTWTPHISLVHPFVNPAVLSATARKGASLAPFPPFPLSFSTVAVMEGQRTRRAKDGRVYVAATADDDSQLRALQVAVVEAFGVGGGEPTSPLHITLGQAPNLRSGRELAAELQAKWLPVSFVVDVVSLLKRSGPEKPFFVAHEVRLGGSGVEKK